MTGLYTKDQMLKVMHAWRVDAEIPLPRKGQTLIIAFPNTKDYSFGQATISINDRGATYGGKLYRVVYSRPRAEHVVDTMLDTESEIPAKGMMTLGFGGSSFPIAGGGQG